MATIEIKGGKDPAGALERLGAMQKSFEATPAQCVNFLVAGVVTAEMRKRLDQMGLVKVFPARLSGTRRREVDRVHQRSVSLHCTDYQVARVVGLYPPWSHGGVERACPNRVCGTIDRFGGVCYAPRSIGRVRGR